MGTCNFNWWVVATECLCLSCQEPSKDVTKPQASDASAATVVTPQPVAEPPPGGCKAQGDLPMQIGAVTGDVYGFASDATHLFCASWQVYGSRGDLSKIRKDGQGSQPLTALKLEPRGLTVDEDTVYYTAGIRLNSLRKEGGDVKTLDAQFSAQSIAADDKAIYGVPGNYGPYDRLAKIAKSGGETIELASAKRPKLSLGPNGYNAIAIDTTGVYVADSGNGRVLKFPLTVGKPKPLVTGVAKPFDLALDENAVYFSLASGSLMMVPKSGGKTTKLTTGLMESARLAADSSAVYVALAPTNQGAKLVKVSPGDGTVTTVASVGESHLVSAISLDRDCVYWAERFDPTKTVVFAR